MLPPFLQPNDEIRIISPSGVVLAEYIDGAKAVLKSWGLRPTEGRFARESYGRFCGTDEQRSHDLQEALNDPKVKAILCSRGGYGLSRIIDKIDFSSLTNHPKWIIGFSDITVLHSALARFNIASLHSIMAKDLSELPQNSETLHQIKETLFGTLQNYKGPTHQLNRSGVGKGKIIGGNLSVLMGLRATPFDLCFDKNILFIEDVGEQAYHIDRMMQNLRMSEDFKLLSGLIVGQFNGVEEDPMMLKTTFEIIAEAVKDESFPVCFNFPAGHIADSFPILLNKEGGLSINEAGVTLNYL